MRELCDTLNLNADAFLGRTGDAKYDVRNNFEHSVPRATKSDEAGGGKVCLQGRQCQRRNLE